MAQSPPPPCGTPGMPSTYIDTLNGIIAFSNDSTGPVGCYDAASFEWECVEFVHRYYSQRFNLDLGSIPVAFQAFAILQSDPRFAAYSQGSTVIPRAEDIVVFGKNAATPYGHVAIAKTDPILQTDGTYQIPIIEQNSYLTHVLMLQGDSVSGFKITGRLGLQNTAPIIGWVRRQTRLTVVVPNALASIDGNSNLLDPDNAEPHFQQVYGASQFGVLNGPTFISEIAFRPWHTYIGSPPHSWTLSNVQVTLSTTTRGPNSLSATFANNTGTDATLVYSGPLTLSTSFTTLNGTTADFDIVIPLQRSFLYDPQRGNLLIDIKNFSTVGLLNVPFSRSLFEGYPVSYVFDFSVDSPTGHREDGAGFVTRFRFGASPPLAQCGPDAVSGQTFQQAFDSVALSLRAGMQPSSVPTQPWFENRLLPSFCAGAASCTSKVAANFTSVFIDGTSSDLCLLLQQSQLVR